VARMRGAPVGAFSRSSHTAAKIDAATRRTHRWARQLPDLVFWGCAAMVVYSRFPPPPDAYAASARVLSVPRLLANIDRACGARSHNDPTRKRARREGYAPRAYCRRPRDERVCAHLSWGARTASWHTSRRRASGEGGIPTGGGGAGHSVSVLGCFYSGQGRQPTLG
jgi:hypothetical protein